MFSRFLSLSGLHHNRRQLGVLSPLRFCPGNDTDSCSSSMSLKREFFVSRSSSIFDRELKYDPWSKVWLVTLALCSSLTALAEYGWLIHQRAEEIKQECQHKILMKDFEYVKNGSTKSFWTSGWEFFIEPVLLCSQKAEIPFGSLSAVYLLPGYLCPNFKIYLKYNKTSYKLHWTKSKFYWAEVTVQSPTSEKLPLTRPGTYKTIITPHAHD